MSWYSNEEWKENNEPLDEYWEWRPSDDYTVYFLFGGAIIAILLFQWVF